MRTIAWTGAALFVAALLYFGYCYAVPFGRLADDAAVAGPITVDLLLFSAFALHHSVLARTGAKQIVTRLMPAPLERPAYVWIASLLFIVVCALWQPVAGVLWNAHGLAAWGLRALSVVGVWLTLQSAIMLDVFELAGTRAFMTPLGGSTELKSHGPYGLVRHPIYLAWLFLVWTPTTMNGTRLVFAAISTAYLVIAIPFEERSLHGTLGPAYAAYAKRVRWRMIPGLY